MTTTTRTLNFDAPDTRPGSYWHADDEWPAGMTQARSMPRRAIPWPLREPAAPARFVGHSVAEATAAVAETTSERTRSLARMALDGAPDSASRPINDMPDTPDTQVEDGEHSGDLLLAVAGAAAITAVLLAAATALLA